jgi:Carboxypeptidase regulatory-like domain
LSAGDGEGKEPGTKDLLPGGAPPQHPGFLEVIVVDASNNNAPLEGITVRITANNNPEKQDGPSGSDGRKRFGPIPPDTYTVTASATGYTIGTANGEVKSDNTTTVTIPLQRSSLEIVDKKTGLVISEKTTDRIIGQKVQVQVRVKGGGKTISKIQWSIPGETVKDYIQTIDRAIKTDLPSGDLESEAVAFYWIGAGNKTVQVSASVDGVAQSPFAAKFNVLAPTDIRMSSETGKLETFVSAAHDHTLWLGYGDASPGAKHGIDFKCAATGPPGGDGQIAGTQLANPDRSLTQNNDVVGKFTSAGSFLLDTSVPYDTAKPIRAGTVANWEASDSPGGNLRPERKRRSFNDKFRMYFMYRPAGPDSIWVTLARLDWDVAGAATRTGDPSANNWSQPVDVSATPNPGGVASTELPVWTANVKDLQWHT